MDKSVEFYFDFGSPAAYLAWTQLPALCAGAQATLHYRPMLLGGVFQATGNRAPISVPLKGSYLFDDLARFARRYGVAFSRNAHFPLNTIALMRMAAGLEMNADPRLGALVGVVFEAIWVEGSNLADPAVLSEALHAAGLDAAGLVALAAQPQVKDRLRQATEAAVARGVFGAPTMFVGSTLYWGQDRLDFVRDALMLPGAGIPGMLPES